MLRGASLPKPAFPAYNSNSNNEGDVFVLERKKRARRGSGSIVNRCCILSTALLLVWLFIFLLFFSSSDSHIAHNFTARVGAVSEWIESAVAERCPMMTEISASALPGQPLLLLNPSFLLLRQSFRTSSYSSNAIGWNGLSYSQLKKERREISSTIAPKHVGQQTSNNDVNTYSDRADVVEENWFWCPRNTATSNYNFITNTNSKDDGSNKIDCIHQMIDLTKDPFDHEFAAILKNNNDNNSNSKLLGLVDAGKLLVKGKALLRRPPFFPPSWTSLHQCYKVTQFCDSTFSDHIWFKLQYFNEEKQLISSLRSLVATDENWQRVTAEGLLPSSTRYIKISICYQYRSIYPDGCASADDISISLHKLSDELLATERIQTEQGGLAHACNIVNKPMLLGIESGEVTVAWVCNCNAAFPSLQWSWETEANQRDSFYETSEFQHAEPVETTQLNHCNYIHKAVINFSEKWKMESEIYGGGSRYPKIKYKAFCGAISSDAYYYNTPQPATASSSITVALVSDNQYGAQVMRHIVHHVSFIKPDFVILGGDMVNKGSSIREWRMYYWHPLEVNDFAQQTPITFVRGNHDGESSIAHAFSSFSTPSDYHAHTRGHVRFIYLNSNAHPAICPHQTRWLEQELQSEEYAAASFRVVILHLPPYTEYWELKEGYSGEKFVREKWVPLFTVHNVDIVVSGHTHAYLRGESNRVTYTVIGGAGGNIDTDRVANWKFFEKVANEHHFVIMKANRCELLWSAYSTDNKLLDSFTKKTDKCK